MNALYREGSAMPRKLPKFFDTWTEVEGNEIDVRVEFDYQPDEPELNVGESLIITSAYRWNEDVLARMSPDECLALAERVLERVHDFYEAMPCGMQGSYR
jgi:hypothetical protein